MYPFTQLKLMLIVDFIFYSAKLLRLEMVTKYMNTTENQLKLFLIKG